MTDFLHTVATHYFKSVLKPSTGRPDYLQLTDWLFIFPNRRAGLFFNYHLCKLNDNLPLFSPRCMNIGDLFGLFSDLRVADHTELLFRLYKVYNEVKFRSNSNFEAERFENFIFWGEMMLRDFDEVDKYLVEAEKLFHNVRDLKELEELMGGLDEDVKSILATFWKNVDPSNTRPGSIKENFTQTWAILYEVYAQFRQVLRAEGLAYEGMRQRDVVEHLLFDDMADRLSKLPKNIVLVGITAINKAERQLLLWLQKQGHLECCWDYADANVQEIKFVKENLQDFPNALSKVEAESGIIPLEQKELYRMAVPSGVGQAAEAGMLLSQWENAQSLETAVVLSDEHLLDAMIYNLPYDCEDYNVTMGCPLKSTPVAALVESLVFLQSNSHYNSQNVLTYYYKAVLPLLSHAFLLELQLEDSTNLRKEITRKSTYQVVESDLQKNDLFQLVFRREAPIPYLRSVLEYLLAAFTPQKEETEETKEDRHILHRECLIVYLKMLNKLEEQIQVAGMEQIDAPSLFHLILKLGQGLSVSYSGEPMKGLQIMGVLETRAIDFKQMIVLSANEGVVPAKPQQNSFIPHTLRDAFGLPTQIYKDLVFAYHFYRMISRAQKVVFLYDSRTDGMQTGEQSRYLLQMQYLNGIEFKQLQPSSHIVTQGEQVIEVAKTPEVRAQLTAFLKGGTRNLSASNLKTFIDCPLQFYFAHVCHLSTEEEMDDELGDSKFGTILHDTLKTFYNQFAGGMVMPDVLKANVNHPHAILDIVKQEYQRQFGCSPDNGYQQLVCTLIANSVKSVLKHDQNEVAPFYYLAGEEDFSVNFEVDNDLVVRLKAVYDRLDIVSLADGTKCIRIVDYKTGNPKDKVQVGEIDKIFDPTTKCSKEAFQVLLYCLMLQYAPDDAKLKLRLEPATANNQYLHVEPHLYFTRSFQNENEESQTLLLEDFEPHRLQIEDQMKSLIRRIFSDEPFSQTDKSEKCKHCKFTKICNKNIKDE